VAILLIAAGLAIGGNLAWELWGTGFTTQRLQAQLRQGFEPRINTLPLKDPTANKVRVPGHAVAILRIPRIHLNMVVVEGTDTESLKKGPGHYTGTAYPWQDHGRVAIAGHRTTYLHPFYYLNEMKPGDAIILATEYGTFRYLVTKVIIIVPSDAWVLNQTDRPTLVLTTCNPRYSAAQRLVVVADRVD
jgi:sortase A